MGKGGQGQGQGTDSRRSSFDVEDALDIDDDELMEGQLAKDDIIIHPNPLTRPISSRI